MPSPDTVLVIPAAGAGTRLRSATPKVLAPVNGRPMLDYLFDLYRSRVAGCVLVVHPAFELAVRRHCESLAASLDLSYVPQSQATGMLDAILLALPEVRRRAPRRIWITWCDQIGVDPRTVDTLERLSLEHPDAPMILPTATQARPYIHLERNQDGRITKVLQRREGDSMPPIGESDMELFSLSPDAYFDRLPRFAGEATASTATRERNFLPFLVWLDRIGHDVITFPCTNSLEALGVNTPDDRDRLEQYLLERERA